MKIVTIAGARPQFIKAAVLSRKLKEQGDFEELIIHTGQHYDKEMSADFFTELQIPEPVYNLGINNLPPAAMTGRMLEAIEPLLFKENPDIVVVYGDTNSTLAGALAAKKLNIPIAHIEAGLRSGDMKMPEEINRVLTDRISDLLFCPTINAAENLHREAFEASAIFLVGDIMYDAALMFSVLHKDQPAVFKPPYALCTFHRQELIQSKEKTTKLLESLSALHSILPVVVVAHPRTGEAIRTAGASPPFTIEGPLGYAEMTAAIEHSELVITDSGGLQKEAYFFKKPCITIRNTTEWKELTDAGVNFLAGDEGDNIIPLYEKIKTLRPDFSQLFYGNGDAAGKIIETIRAFIKERAVP